MNSSTENYEATLKRSLKDVVHELKNRPSKNLRSKVVDLGYQFIRPYVSKQQESLVKQNCNILQALIEDLHDGSLIIDDIQDQDSVRRGGPAIHRMFGDAVALNAGNWLYFKALTRVENLQIPDESKFFLFRDTVRALLKAHEGQALDLGSNLSHLGPDEAEKYCLKVLRLKTGALMSLTTGPLFYFCDDLPASACGDLFALGELLGLALQIYDDFEELSRGIVSTEFRQQRPHWPWALVARVGHENQMARIRKAISDESSDADILKLLLENDLLEKGLLYTRQFLQKELDALLSPLEWQCPPEAVQHARDFLNDLSDHYIGKK